MLRRLLAVARRSASAGDVQNFVKVTRTALRGTSQRSAVVLQASAPSLDGLDRALSRLQSHGGGWVSYAYPGTHPRTLRIICSVGKHAGRKRQRVQKEEASEEVKHPKATRSDVEGLFAFFATGEAAEKALRALLPSLGLDNGRDEGGTAAGGSELARAPAALVAEVIRRYTFQRYADSTTHAAAMAFYDEIVAAQGEYKASHRKIFNAVLGGCARHGDLARAKRTVRRFLLAYATPKPNLTAINFVLLAAARSDRPSTTLELFRFLEKGDGIGLLRSIAGDGLPPDPRAGQPSQLRPSRVSFEAYARACAKIGAVDAAVDTLEKAKAPQDFQEALHSSDGVELHRLLDDAAILEKQEAEDEGDLPQRKEDAKPPKQREKAAAGPLVPPTASHRQFETSHVRPILHQESKVSEQLAMMLVDQEARKSRTEPLWPLSVFYDYTAKLLSEKPSTPPEAVQSPPPSAKELIHAYRAPDGSYEVDLHGCTALEARARVRLALDEIERVQEGELRIITGKGNSSAGSPASLQAAVLDLFADLKLICRNESGNIGRLVIPLDELRAFWKRSQTDRMTLGMRNMLALQLLLVLSGGLATVVIQSIT